MAGRAFAAGLATIQRRKMSGPHAKYRVRLIALAAADLPCRLNAKLRRQAG